MLASVVVVGARIGVSAQPQVDLNLQAGRHGQRSTTRVNRLENTAVSLDVASKLAAKSSDRAAVPAGGRREGNRERVLHLCGWPRGRLLVPVILVLTVVLVVPVVLGADPAK